VTRPNARLLFLLLALYAVASLVHFVHNAEFLGDYPGLPASWSRGGVYLAWIGMSALGGVGALLAYRTREAIGLILLAVYATRQAAHAAQHRQVRTDTQQIRW